jgi:hypothetical protein
MNCFVVRWMQRDVDGWMADRTLRGAERGTACSEKVKILFELFTLRRIFFIERNEGNRTRYCIFRKSEYLFELFRLRCMFFIEGNDGSRMRSGPIEKVTPGG